MQGYLLDKLLKTRYPLSYYLIRQQEFIRVFTPTPTDELFTPSESEASVIRQRKASLCAAYNVSDTKVHHHLVERHSHFLRSDSDQDYYSTHDQSTEVDDDDSQEYDARPLSNSIRGKKILQRR